MKRDYDDGIRDDVRMFTGIEVEHTPAFGMKTLFVVGIHLASDIENNAREHGCDHIYLGANQSFNPLDHNSMLSWEGMAKALLVKKFLVTLDFDVRHTEVVLEMCLSEFDNFIPQVSVKIPYARQLGYNACIKIDDKDFRASNDGVWVHQLHDLMDREKFTDWNAYGKDMPL